MWWEGHRAVRARQCREQTSVQLEAAPMAVRQLYEVRVGIIAHGLRPKKAATSSRRAARAAGALAFARTLAWR